MKLLLIQIAAFAVVFHMTFGCLVHHGIGSSGACVNQSGLSTCRLDGHAEPLDIGDDKGPEWRNGNHDQELSHSGSTVKYETHGSSHNHGHLQCQDDSCFVTNIVKFVCAPFDFSTAYLGGAEDSAVVKLSAHSGIVLEPFPDCSHTALKLHLHLLLGMQVL